MNKREGRYTGKPSCVSKKQIKVLQIPHRRILLTTKPNADRRVSLCACQKGSLTLETALVLPLLLCAVTALLWLFAFTSVQAREYRTLTERAQILAVTVGQASKEEPYIRLYDYRMAQTPFPLLSFGKRSVVQQAVVRAWVGYTGESFAGMTDGQMVYVTPEREVYHRSRDCTYLTLTVRAVAFEGLDAQRNQSGGKYAPCEYCVKKGTSQSTVYITDYGTSYHYSGVCQGLKRTVMSIPFSETAGMRCCSRCRGSP